MRKFMVRVNGKEYEVDVEEVDGGRRPVVDEEVDIVKADKKPAPAPKKEARGGAKVELADGQESVEAPMPGTILSVLVREGDSVAEGDTLMVLEAMKMENEILAPRSGLVKSLGASEGSTVDTGDKLIILE